MVIISFTIVSICLLINDFVSFNSPDCIVLIPQSKLANDVLWFVMRCLGYQIWAVPIIYVFWPEKVKQKVMMVETEGSSETSYTEISINN